MNINKLDFIAEKLNKRIKQLKLHKKIYAIGVGDVITLLVDNNTNYFKHINFNLNDFSNDVDLLYCVANKTIDDLNQ